VAKGGRATCSNGHDPYLVAALGGDSDTGWLHGLGLAARHSRHAGVSRRVCWPVRAPSLRSESGTIAFRRKRLEGADPAMRSIWCAHNVSS